MVSKALENAGEDALLAMAVITCLRLEEFWRAMTQRSFCIAHFPTNFKILIPFMFCANFLSFCVQPNGAKING